MIAFEAPLVVWTAGMMVRRPATHEARAPALRLDGKTL